MDLNVATTLLTGLLFCMLFTIAMGFCVLAICVNISKLLEIEELFDEDEDFVITEDGEVIPYDEDTQE